MSQSPPAGFSSAPYIEAEPVYDEVQPTYIESMSTPAGTPTRTVAIIKNHALSHRFDIEPRILEASFEIVKERQMEFDVETDPETLYELFGEDAESLGEGPVWVYVLERRRAVEVWNTLMGDRDPAKARENSPNTLRALYGLSQQQNGLMGSPDVQTAEVQIASLFASSPPFPTTELPDALESPTVGRFDTMQSVSSSVLSALRAATSDEGYAPSAATNTSSNGKVVTGDGKVLFRARRLPSTHLTPSIQPRTTKAAALRAGILPDKTGPSSPRAPPTKEKLAKTFANVPGHKRTETIAVASTAPPSIAPRMTRAASLRLGQQPPPAPVRRPKLAETKTTGDVDAKKDSFEGVPGHKRRESIAVASTQAPTVAPRTNRSAALRAQKDAAPPSSFMFRAPSAPKTPGRSRSSSQTSLGGGSRPSTISRSSSVASMNSTAARPSLSRTTTGSSHIPSQITSPTGPLSPSENPSTPEPAVKARPRPSSVASAPSIAPRTNKSAALRAAKMALNGANGATKAKSGPAKPGSRALVA